nr:LuxR C-terminal-related transcriptional regulator [Pseudomonas sp. Hg5Tf]
MVHHEGVSVREAARRLCISRNTAKRWLSAPQGGQPRYPQRATAAGLLDRYKEHLLLWLKAGIDSGERQRSSVATYFECLQAIGFPGSKSLVYRYCRSWKLQLNNAPGRAGSVPLNVEPEEACTFVGLTTREREVLSWVARGRSCREIASSMGIASLTVRKHRCNILGKCGLHSTAQLVAFAVGTLQRQGQAQDQLALSRLSARERQVVMCLAKGLTSKEIAKCLRISPATVRKHREHAMKSMGVHTMASLMWYAVGGERS